MRGRPAHTDFFLRGIWPSHEQTLVLQAALRTGDGALAAFREWLALINIEDNFDLPTLRLMPLLYDNLRRLGVRHPLMGRLTGAYRLVWYQNHRLFDELRPVVAALADAGIPTMLLKGVPLVLNDYRNYALRPMADIDILVPFAEAPRAVELLTARGWQPGAPASPDLFRFRHALALNNANGREIDIHWHGLYELSAAGGDDFLWSTARPLDFGGVATGAPDPTRHLIVTLVHGVRWNPEPPIRWIPDSMMIMRRSVIAWDELIAFAGERRLSYRLWLGLCYLRERFDAPVPEQVLAELQGHGLSLVERIENSVALTNRTPLQGTRFGSLWFVFAHYCRYAHRARPWQFVIGFAHYLRFRWRQRGHRGRRVMTDGHSWSSRLARTVIRHAGLSDAAARARKPAAGGGTPTSSARPAGPWR